MKDFLSYTEACEVVRKCKITTRLEFRKFNKGKSIATKIPACPNNIYKEWTNWGDFLGTGSKSNTYNKKIVSYDEAKIIINTEISSIYQMNKGEDYRKFVKTDLYNEKYKTILPVAPDSVYKYHKSWISWNDFLMITFNSAISYSELKELFLSYNVHDFDAVNHFIINVVPSIGVVIPRDIETHYKSKNDWVSWDDLLKHDDPRSNDISEKIKVIEDAISTIKMTLKDIVDSLK